MKPKWVPQWEVEQRKPNFDYDNYHESGRNLERKSLWSLPPAIDILKLESNEGVNHEKDLDLLFTCDIDLNNVVNTVASIPADFQSSVNTTINKVAGDTFLRDVIILAFAMMEESKEVATEAIINLWYSAFLMDIVMSKFKPSHELSDIMDEPLNLGPSTLRASLRVWQWIGLQSSLETPIPVTTKQA
ncbi:hypothetical protein F4809DRAFT_655868 [Biscogniauxia mediterranea]|nr:hypothetical protein F4809DRAFT_655868 [Biscogniauxia mediterranea]